MGFQPSPANEYKRAGGRLVKSISEESYGLAYAEANTLRGGAGNARLSEDLQKYLDPLKID